MNNNTENQKFIMDRVRLSHIYNEIGKCLQEHGDADVRSISSISGSKDKAIYAFNLSDLNSFDISQIGEIRIKRDEIPYTYDEWKTGCINKSTVKIR